MPADFRFLLDAPTGDPKRRLQIAKLGSFTDPRYGKFKITRDEVNKWASNLSILPGGRAPIDLDHSADKPGGDRNTSAAGWITGVTLENGQPFADVEWTPIGEQAIRDKIYLFFSPTYGTHTDETGAKHPDTLIGGALTNRPFLSMPMVSLAAVPFAAEDRTASSADSPAAMTPIPAIAKALGLAEDADEAKILEAISAQTTEPADTKTLEQRASDEGKVLLDAGEHETLKAKADKAESLEDRVKTLEADAANDKFEIAFTKALEAGKVDAKDETRTAYRELFDSKPDVTLTLLDGLPKIVNLEAQGTGGADGDIDVPAGGDSDRFELHAAAEAYAAKNNVSYDEASLAVAGGN